VVGFDLSPSLVAKANEDATHRGFANLSFETLDLMAGLPPVQADAIFCLGVFSCIHEDKVWLGLLDSFSSILGQGGILVLRETLGTRAASRVMHPAGYYACYRTVGEYLAETTARSFSLVEDVELFKRSDGLENHLYLFRKC
jgi:cyclopropane fatty-acyl-phospholipid synthase-like methyltransferase